MRTARPHPLLLPAPLPSSSYAVGQLLTALPTTSGAPSTDPAPNPLTPRAYDDTHTTAYYKDILALSPTGTITASLGGERLVPAPAPGTTLLLLEAEQMCVRELKDVRGALGRVVGSVAGRDWVLQQLDSAPQEAKPLYFVTAVQAVKNASYKLLSTRPAAGAANSGLVEVVRASHPVDLDLDLVRHGSEKEKRPAPLHRRDSGFASQSPPTTREDVLGLEVRAVSVRLETPDAPHRVSDLGYSWIYQGVGGREEVLLVGLGGVVGGAGDVWGEDGEVGESEGSEESGV